MASLQDYALLVSMIESPALIPVETTNQIAQSMRVPNPIVGSYQNSFPSYSEAKEYAKALANAQVLPVIQVPDLSQVEPIEIHTIGKQTPMILNDGVSVTPYSVLDHDEYRAYVDNCTHCELQIAKCDRWIEELNEQIKHCKNVEERQALMIDRNEFNQQRHELASALAKFRRNGPIQARVMTNDSLDGYTEAYKASKDRYKAKPNKGAYQGTYGEFQAEVSKRTYEMRRAEIARQEKELEAKKMKALMDKKRVDDELDSLPWCILTGRNQYDEQAPWYTTNDDGEPTVLFFGDPKHRYVGNRQAELARLRAFKEGGSPKAPESRPTSNQTENTGRLSKFRGRKARTQGRPSGNELDPREWRPLPTAGEKRQHPPRPRKGRTNNRACDECLGSYDQTHRLNDRIVCTDCLDRLFVEPPRPKLTQAGYH